MGLTATSVFNPEEPAADEEAMGDLREAPAIAAAEISATLAPMPPGMTAEPLRAAAFERELARQLANVRRYGPEGGLVRLDVDRLADVAPAEAPAVTSAIVRVLLGVLRPADVLGRIGPDDFVVLLPRADMREAALTADALLSAIHDAQDSFRGGAPRVTVSAGVMLFDRPELTVSQALAEAESALAEAKEAGPGRVAIATALDRDSEVTRRTGTREERIRAAIIGRELALHGQPVVDLATGVVDQVEALVRLRLDGDLATATEFLPVAERWSLAGAVDAWVVEEVARVLAEAPGDAPPVAVNLSGASLADLGFARRAALALAAGGVAPDRVSFEIAESDVLSAPVAARRAIDRLRAEGFDIALDGVVDGVGALTALGRPPSLLKLSSELVAAAASGPVERAIVHGLVGIARNLGMRTVATRAADDDLVAVARALGADLVQGHALASPGPLECVLRSGSPRPV